MKYRDSGMPDVELWETFFDPYFVLNHMEIDSSVNRYLDIGCGYGTFLFPASERVQKAVGYDIDENMIHYCLRLKDKYNVPNVELIQGDIAGEFEGRFLESNRNSFDYVSLFNILHCEEPVNLLKFARNLINDSGRIGVIHWQYRQTPRGPAMEIRPKPEQIIQWAHSASLKLTKSVDLPPHHYGLLFTK